jgi:hypothetical protein
MGRATGVVKLVDDSGEPLGQVWIDSGTKADAVYSGIFALKHFSEMYDDSVEYTGPAYAVRSVATMRELGLDELKALARDPWGVIVSATPVPRPKPLAAAIVEPAVFTLPPQEFANVSLVLEDGRSTTLTVTPETGLGEIFAAVARLKNPDDPKWVAVQLVGFYEGRNVSTYGVVERILEAAMNHFAAIGEPLKIHVKALPALSSASAGGAARRRSRRSKGRSSRSGKSRSSKSRSKSRSKGRRSSSKGRRRGSTRKH